MAMVVVTYSAEEEGVSAARMGLDGGLEGG